MDHKEKTCESNDNSSQNNETDETIVVPEDPAFGLLTALNAALDRRISVSTSRIRLRRDDPSSEKLVVIDGSVDEEILEYLEESVSDILSSTDDLPNVIDETPSAQSRAPEGQSVHDKDSSSSKTSQDEGAVSNDGHEIKVKAGSVEAPRSTTGSSKRFATNKGDSFYSIPSCTSSFDGIVEPEALRRAEEAIADLERNGPAGLVHLSSLSEAIGKPLRVWTSGNEESRKIGRTRTGEPVDIEYHEPQPGDSQGHWTLRGNLEPRDVRGQLNDCLFCVVADQIGHVAPELRAETIARMRKCVKSLAHRIENIARREKCDRISLLVGGARYNGQRPQDMARIIDNSQTGRCSHNGLSGHARGHASHPSATGLYESVENYSTSGWKTAFLSREDQDAVGHLIMTTQQAQNAMDRLNLGATTVAVYLSPSQLKPGPLPMAGEWEDGSRTGGDREIRDFVIVLRHHYDLYRDPGADVFVHTFYPRIRKS